MKEHPNVAVARGLWSALAEGDGALFRERLSAEVVWRVHGNHPLSGEHRGPDEVTDFFARIGEAADELVSDLRDIYPNDRGAVLVYRVRARKGVKSIDVDFLLELMILDGKVVRARSIPTDQRAVDDFWTYAAGGST